MPFGISPATALRYLGPKYGLMATVQGPRRPTTGDKNYPIQTFWRVEKNPQTGIEGEEWMLVKFETNGDATWQQLALSSSSGELDTLSTDSGTSPVSPDGNGDIAIVGNATQGISTVGGTNQVTVTAADATDAQKGVSKFNSADFTVSSGTVSLASSSIVLTFTGDNMATAGPTAGNVNIVGDGSFIETSTTGNTITISQSGPASDGQLIIGSTASGPQLAALTQPAAGLSITGGSGSITFALTNDLAGLEGLASTGFATRTGSDTWAQRTITPTTNEIDVSNGDGVSGNPTLTLSDTIDIGDHTSLEIPNSAAPTLNTDGQIAIDTTVIDFSHGLIKYYSGEEMGVVAMPIAQFVSPTDQYVVSYNATNDEFELVASGGSGGGAGSFVFLDEQDVTGVTSVSFDSTYITATYETYMIVWSDLQTESHGSGDGWKLRYSPNNGATVRTDDYKAKLYTMGSTYSNNWGSAIPLALGGTSIVGRDFVGYGRAFIYDPFSATKFTCAQSTMSYSAHQSYGGSRYSAGHYENKESHNYFQISSDGHVGEKGIFRLYGLKKS